MTDIHYVTVQIRAPRGDNDYGQIEEGFYRVEGDVVALVNAKGEPRYNKNGAPIQCAIGPGETARTVAWRLTKQHMPNRRSGFSRPLRYFNPEKI